ncbi:NUDIX domain-containing protein [Streptomyces sp. CS014]|uniref:NUDIX hydrolase n=1 Tax=Streptomyces sp. CS014 TaxID=2162707 RepID=UPI000D51758B|nr:NUDIX domain-containing protein [Streptomyces sp. CS014]PVD04479.1 NUDIX hydrolase [Streptomyces sp. CS014]
MSPQTVRQKVLCYIVRDEQLLVFRHADYSWEEVGVQVPAGSIREGETPEAAALREAGEETGLTGFRIIRKLGEAEYDMTPYRSELQQRHVFHLEADGPVPDRWDSQEDHDGEQEPTRFECFWIPLKQAHVLQSGQGALLGRLYE